MAYGVTNANKHNKKVAEEKFTICGETIELVTNKKIAQRLIRLVTTKLTAQRLSHCRPFDPRPKSVLMV